MSKNKRSMNEIDMLFYRIEIVEKRLDLLEQQSKGSSGGISMDVLTALLDVLARQQQQQQQQQKTNPPSQNTEIIQSLIPNEIKTPNVAADVSYHLDNLACLGRRRTLT